jgi:Peptidase family S41
MKHFALSFTLLTITNCLYSQTENIKKVITGKWLLELRHNDIGIAKTYMEFESNENTFKAYARKKADKDILGSGKAILARTFTKSFKKGSLLHITNGTAIATKDTVLLKGIFKSAIGNYNFKGYVLNGQLVGELSNRAGQKRGSLSGAKTLQNGPLENYPDIFQKSLLLTEEKIFNKAILKTDDWKQFKTNMEKVSLKVQDDVEMVFAFFYNAGKLPISHFALLKMLEEKNNWQPSKNKFISFEEKNTTTAYMKISSFSGMAYEMDSMFNVIYKNNTYKNLIVDLRDNSGGSIEAGMAFAKHVIDSTQYGGIFLTQKWFNANTTIPLVKDYTQFKTFNESSFNLIIEGIHKTDGLCLKIEPHAIRYNGNVFVLTNKKTGSTCEPIVYALKKQKNCTIIGEKTAGGMLNGEIFPLANGYSMVIPTADYYTADGFRIDQQGVMPTIKTPSKEALDYVMMNLIIKKK